MSAVHLSDIDLNLLVVLSELLQSRSTTTAARRLGRTQSAVSHALARLRATFGDELFVRVGATLRPTALAERIRPELAHVLASVEAIVSRTLSFDPAELRRTFVLGATDYAEIVVLPRLLPRLRKEAPGVDVTTRFVGDDLERATQACEVDLAYATRFRALAGVVEDKVGHERMMVLLRKNHPALKKRFGAREYAALDHVLVSPRGLPGGVVDRALLAIGLERRVVLIVPHFAAAALIVAQTDLIVTLPEGFARQMAKSAPLVALEVPFELAGFDFSIAYSATMKDDPAHVWFRERVIAAARGR